MRLPDSILIIFGALLVIIIIAMLIRIHYVIKQQGVQISVLLKHDKEGFVPWRERAKVHNLSTKYRQNLLPENKQLEPHGQMWAINNQRARRPQQALTTEQLKRYDSSNTDGLLGHSERAEDLNITTEQSLKTGNLSSVDVDIQSNYVNDEGPVIDQSGVVQDDISMNQSEGFRVAMSSGNHRVVPSFLASMTEGFKQGNESTKTRYRTTHKGQHTY